MAPLHQQQETIAQAEENAQYSEAGLVLAMAVPP